MAQAVIKSVWRANGFVNIAVEVNEGTAEHPNVEFYQARIPLSDMVGKTNIERREMLRLAIKAVRDQKIEVVQDEPGYTGTIDI